MRVTGGELGGRRLRVPASGVRPSADRVRESLFAWLGDLEGVRALDLYAGSGALGIEALSRGAATAVFVDVAAPSLAALRRNLADLGLRERTRVVRGDVVRARRRSALASTWSSPILRMPRTRANDCSPRTPCAISSPRVERWSSSAGGVMICRPQRVSRLSRSATTATRVSFATWHDPARMKSSPRAWRRATGAAAA